MKRNLSVALALLLAVVTAAAQPSVRLNVQLDQVGNVGSGTDLLHTFSLNPGALGADGDKVVLEARGQFGYTGTSKTVRAEIAGQPVFSLSPATWSQDSWRLTCEAWRVNSRTLRTRCSIKIDNAIWDNVSYTQRNEFQDIPFSNPLAIETYADGVNDDDVVEESFEVFAILA